MPTEQLEELDALKDKIILYLVENGTNIAVKVLVAAVIAAIGFWLAKKIATLIVKVCDKRQIDVTWHASLPDSAN